MIKLNYNKEIEFSNKVLSLKRKIIITNSEIRLKGYFFKEKVILINELRKIVLHYKKKSLKWNEKTLFKISFSLQDKKHLEFKLNGFTDTQKFDLEKLLINLSQKGHFIELNRKFQKFVGIVNGVPIFHEVQSEKN